MKQFQVARNRTCHQKGACAVIGVREIARLAGVSPATVSRVINGSAGVDAEKRKRVESVIAQTNYVPNETARSLYRKSSRIIGLIIPSIRNPYFTEMASVIDEEVKAQGFRLFVCNVGNDLAQQRSALQMLTAMNVDGVIVATTQPEIQEELAQCTIPVVVLDGLFDTTAVNAYVHCDYYQGGRMAMEHLLKCGCKNIVCVRGPEEVFSADARYEGYRDVCEERGITQKVVTCDYDFDAGLAITEELLKTWPEVNGIVACNDIVAISIYKILHRKNIDVPGQIQLIGFDDVSFSGLMSPGLSTIRQPIAQLGQRATQLLLSGKGAPKEGKREVLPVTLICRETTQ